jgi:hypothetical protein
MKANVAYEVFKALSDEEKGYFMTLVQNDEYNLRIVTPKNKKAKKVLISEQEAIELLLKTIFSKPQKCNS